MGSFGENLRRERELRGVTLAELANATKINPRYLRALEEDQYETLPGGIFGRGFVRSIARYMNLDENHWVGAYATAANQPPETLSRYAPPRLKGPSSRARWSFVLLLMIFGGGAYLVHDLNLRLQETAGASAPSKPAVTAPEASQAGAVDPAPTTVSDSGAALKASSGKLNLQIDIIDDAWLQVNVDGRTEYEGLMQAGDMRSFRAARQIELVTGNASAVVLTLNSETLAPLGSPGERKTVVLTAADLGRPAP
jgi:cytoskeletal protein RodZ